MAVEANKRKRKHKDNAQELIDDGEVAVPKKIAKQSNSPKKRKNKQSKEQNAINDNEVDFSNAIEVTHLEQEKDPSQDSGLEPDEKYMKFSNDFKMLNFRAKLRGTNFITELRHFLHVTKTRPNFVAKYIEKRGKPLELAEAFERIDKANVLNAAYLADALRLVLMEILTNQNHYMEPAEHAARYFLKNHSNVVDILLKSEQLTHRCIALKLLTAFVCIEPQLGRIILASYDILNDVRTIDKFLSHSKFELNESETVRKCFIHFVLSYLVDGNILLIRNIIDRGALIRALASGLVYDDHVTACVVLNALRQYVLECTDISKTKKIHVFDMECCRHFARLYDWLGPKVYLAKNKSETELGPENLEKLINADELENVAKVAHEFLIVLLTSRKFGITFDALKQFRKKHNVLQGKIIGFLNKPWLNERKTDLIIKILHACPELTRKTIRNFSSIVNPMRTGKRHWTAAADFLTKLITNAHPHLLRSALQQQSLTDFIFWIKDVCLPLETLVFINNTRKLRSEDLNTRLATNRLLLAMFTQYSNFMFVIMQREQAKSGGGVGRNSLRRFKFDLLNHILLNFPTVEEILLSLDMTIKIEEYNKLAVLEHLELTLDLILIICKQNRSFVDKTNTILNYLNMLRPLYAADEVSAVGAVGAVGVVDVATKKRDNIKIELKAVRTILLLYPKALEPSEELFRSVVPSFIKAFVYGANDEQLEAGELLRKIFKNVGIFDGCELEIDLWLEALKFFDHQTIDVVTQVFIEVLQVTNADVEMPKNVDQLTNVKNIRKLFEKIRKGLYVKGYIEFLTISKLLPLIFKGVEIVKPLNKYLELVCLLMYHYFPNPGYVLQLYNMKFNHFNDYMRSWLLLEQENGKTQEIQGPLTLSGKIATLVPYLQALQMSILNGISSFDQIFAFEDAQKFFEIDLQGKLLKLSEVLQNKRMLMIYVQQILFIVAQLTETQQLQQQQADRAANFLIKFLIILQKLDENDKEQNFNFNNNNNNNNDDDDVNDNDKQLTYNNSDLNTILKYIFVTRISYINSGELFCCVDVTHLNYLLFLQQLVQHCQTLENFDIFVRNYQQKIVKAVAVSFETLEETKSTSNKLTNVIKLVKSFNLTTENCIEILELLASKLKYSDFFIMNANDEKMRLTSVYYELLVVILQRLVILQKTIKCDIFVHKFVKFYYQFIKKFGAGINIESLDDAFYEFLLISHQYITQLDVKFFACMFMERKLTKSSIKLTCLLLERDDKLNEEFLKYLNENNEKRELIYPLLNVILRKNVPIDVTILRNAYQTYKNGFMKTIEKPQKAGIIYKENVAASVALIEQCMPKSECIDFCNKNLKFDCVEIYQMRIINAIYHKAIMALEEQHQTTTTTIKSKQNATVFVKYVDLQVQMMLIEFKKQCVDIEKFELFAYQLYNWLTMEQWQKDIKAAADFTKLLKTQQWLNFCKKCVKLGMSMCSNEVDATRTTTTKTTVVTIAAELNALLLKILAFLCEQLYVDYVESNEEMAVASNNEVAQLFELVCTHSKFNDILLLQQLQQENVAIKIKTELLYLLYTLAKKQPQALIDEKIVHTLLGAYQAKLSAADRYILALLQLYELHDCVSLQKYRPFIWGESAIAFYSLRDIDNEQQNDAAAITNDATTSVVTKLNQQETSIAQVMSLIDKQLADYTIENFPIWRKLNTLEQMPLIQFKNPLKSITCNFGANDLEQSIENGIQIFDKFYLRLCPKNDNVYAQCYDPSFFVPLMSMCFAPGIVTHTARPVQNGLLALTFTALSSQDKEMRLAAGNVQMRYRAHFEQHKFFERPLWSQAYDNIQAGLHDLRLAWMKHSKHDGIPRVPLISGLFVAKTFNITTEPTNLLYKQLTMYLRLKSSFDFQCIPEFNVLFYSAEVEHHVFRHFIVEIIRNGIKCGTDLFVLLTTNTFKVLMDYYNSNFSTLESNLQLLSVFSTCVKIPATIKIMIENIGILSWLQGIVRDIEFHQFDIIEGVISNINNLWYSLKANEMDFDDVQYHYTRIHGLILTLLPELSTRTNVKSFAKLLNIMQKTANQNYLYLTMDVERLNNLINVAKNHFPTQIYAIESIKLFGGGGAPTREQYCKQLTLEQHQQNLNEDAILALISLREYAIQWWHVNNENENEMENKCENVHENEKEK